MLLDDAQLLVTDWLVDDYAARVGGCRRTFQTLFISSCLCILKTEEKTEVAGCGFSLKGPGLPPQPKQNWQNATQGSKGRVAAPGQNPSLTQLAFAPAAHRQLCWAELVQPACVAAVNVATHAPAAWRAGQVDRYRGRGRQHSDHRQH